MMKNSTLRIVLTTLASTLLSVGAQEVSAEGTAPDLTMMDIITKGGGIMYVLVALSFVAVMLIIFYLLTLRKNVLLR